MLGSPLSRNHAQALLPAAFKERGKSRLLLIAAAGLTLFMLYNYSFLAGGNWLLHPDDHGHYFFGKLLKDTGSLTVLAETSGYVPPGGYFRDGLAAPRGLPGMYYLTEFGLFLGDQGPFLLISALGIAGVVFFYLTVRQLLGTRVALGAAVIYGLSVPAVYWSNMLYGHAPGMALLFAGYWFLLQGFRGRRGWDLFIGALALSVAGLFRLELVAFAFVPAVAIFWHRRNEHWRTVGLAFGGGIAFAITIGALFSSAAHGTPFALGYAADPVSAAVDSGGRVATLNSFVTRFLKQSG